MGSLNRPSVGALIQELIAAASDKDVTLEQVLLKAQVLGARLGNTELVRWAKNEIEGYGDKTIPAYRRVAARLRGDCIGQSFNYMVHGPQDIPLDVIPEDYREDFRRWTILQGVAAIEALLLADKGTTPRVHIDHKIQDTVRRQLNGPDITSIYLEIAPASLRAMLSTVRSRLLDLVLALDAEFGEAPPEKLSDLNDPGREHLDRVIHMHITGDGNAVSIDSPHSQQTTQIECGDWSALESELRRLGIPPTDVAALKAEPAGAMAWLQRTSMGAAKIVGATAMKQVTKAVLAYAGVPS